MSDINKNKDKYYELLQYVRDSNDWEPWLVYMLTAVEVTSKQTITIINEMKLLIMKCKTLIKKEEPKIYSHELINNLFKHPYTKIDFVVNDLQVHRNTAQKYLTALSNIGILHKHKIGTENYYLNTELFNLLSNVGHY